MVKKHRFFNEGTSEEEIKQWEENNKIKIPETYKEWLRFSVDWGWRIALFFKRNGNFIRWFEGKVNDEFENFGDVLKEIIQMLKEKSEISKKAELKLQLII